MQGTSGASGKRDTHCPIVDAARGLAALIVALDHGLLPTALPIPGGASLVRAMQGFVSAPAAVLLFFVISGFCIHFPIRQRDVSTAEFLTRRFVRLLVPLLGASLLAYGVGYPWFQIKFGEPVIWSLLCEGVYYCFYIAVRKLWVPTPWTLLAAVTFAVAVVVAVLGRHIPEYPRRDLVSVILLGLPVWLFGVLVAARFDSLIASSPALWLRILSWLALLFLPLVATWLAHARGVSYALTLTAYSLCVPIWLGVSLNQPAPNSLRRLGDFSYSLYLVHQPLIGPLRRILTKAGVGAPGSIPNAFIALALVLVVAYAFYLLVERPSHQLSRRLGGLVAARTRPHPVSSL